MTVETHYAQLHAELEKYTAWRRDIHAHPELGFEEQRTASFVAEKLETWGIEVQRGLAGTGVVGRLSKGKTGPGIGLRADLDALPMQELNSFDYKSIFPGKFHGCGHDGHTVMLLAAAQYLAQHGQFSGTVYFIFQPAEEGLGGAHAMIEDGLFDSIEVQSVYAMHNAPSIPAGNIIACPGPLLAAFEKFDITLTGVGCHGAMPHQGVDPIVIAAQLIQALQTLVSRNLEPIKAGVVSITKIHSGDAYNVIPEQVQLSGAIRYLEPETGEQIKHRLTDLVTTLPKASGATGELVFHPVGYPPLINDADCSAMAAEVARQLVGKERVSDSVDPIMGSDDFAYMLQEKPGCYVLIGNGVGSQGGCVVHHPNYDFNDEIIPVGAGFWAKLVETELRPVNPISNNLRGH